MKRHQHTAFLESGRAGGHRDGRAGAHFDSHHGAGDPAASSAGWWVIHEFFFVNTDAERILNVLVRVYRRSKITIGIFKISTSTRKMYASCDWKPLNAHLKTTSDAYTEVKIWTRLSRETHIECKNWIFSLKKIDRGINSVKTLISTLTMSDKDSSPVNLHLKIIGKITCKTNVFHFKDKIRFCGTNNMKISLHAYELCWIRINHCTA